MWMQVLRAAGLPVIGEAFPSPWGESLREANPLGFYESQLAAGVYHATNPHPQTGAYLFPEATRQHVVKVFVPGLVRTDVAFLDAVIATVRPWREVAASGAQLRAIAPEGSPGHLPEEVSAPLWWWAETFALVRDIATRRYAAHVVSYERVVQDPEREVGAVIAWLGCGEVAPAVAAVEPSLRRSVAGSSSAGELSDEEIEVLDALYDRLHEGRPLDGAFVQRLNALDVALRPRLLAARERARMSLVSRWSFEGEVRSVR